MASSSVVNAPKSEAEAGSLIGKNVGAVTGHVGKVMDSSRSSFNKVYDYATSNFVQPGIESLGRGMVNAGMQYGNDSLKAI